MAILGLRVIASGGLYRLIGRLSFAETAAFGRIWRPMMSTIYRKQNGLCSAHICLGANLTHFFGGGSPGGTLRPR